MSDENWQSGFAKSLGIFLNGESLPNPNRRGEPVTDDSFYLLLNAHHEPIDFRLPGLAWGKAWVEELDTTNGWPDQPRRFEAGGTISVTERSLVVIRRES
jgi:glycogen operon protein